MESTNLSAKKRERLLGFLNELRESNKNDEKVITAINEIEKELNNKKYGLVWEEHEEEVDRMLKDNIPVFCEQKDKEVKESEDGYNFLLEGDNLHSLKLLEKTHKGKIDVIYIDPPYNTGNEDFVYEDNIVKKEDSFRHSKWLSFMETRISCARELLSDKGILFISIDDNEYANLKLMCDEKFGEDNYISSYIKQSKVGGGSDSRHIVKEHEYCLVYAKNIDAADEMFIEHDEKYLKRYKEEDEKGLFFWDTFARPGLKNPIHYDIVAPDGTVMDYGWIHSKERFEKELEEGIVRIIPKKDGGWSVQFKQYLNSKGKKPRSLSMDFGGSIEGKNDIKKVFNDDKIFSYPKSSMFIKKLLSTLLNDSICVLDFFAGSGTTAQAVLELNKEDGGNRKFILCTNNENNICEDITYQRVKTVITGKRKDGSEYSEGIPANLKYYKTDFVSKDEEYLADELNNYIKELIQLEHGIDVDGSEYCLVLSDEDADELESKIDKMTDLEGIYISNDVLLTTKQKNKFKDLEQYIIPDYYYDKEMKNI